MEALWASLARIFRKLMKGVYLRKALYIAITSSTCVHFQRTMR
jgi:hypothetical protein